MISLGYYCSTRHFFTTYCVNCACVDRTTPTYYKILPIILGIILNSFVYYSQNYAGIIYLALGRERERGREGVEGGGREGYVCHTSYSNTYTYISRGVLACSNHTPSVM